MKSTFRLSLAALTLCLATVARAEVRTGDDVTIRSGETIDGNLYASAGTVVVHGDVTGDLVTSGGTLIVDGHVGGDVLAVGGELTIAGSVGGDVRVAGGRVLLSGPIGGDTAVAAGDIDVEGHVRGDALLAGGTAHIAGDVEGRLYAATGDVRIDGHIGKDVNVSGGRMLLGATSRIDGNVDYRYQGTERIERAPGAAVAGAVHEQPAPGRAVSRNARVFGWLQALIGSFLLGALWLGFFRGFAERSMRTLATHPGKSVGFGALALCAIPIVLALALAVGALIGGWWIAMFGGAIFLMALALTMPLVAAQLGRAVLTRLKIPVTSTWVPMAAALVVLFLLLRVPVLGGLIGFAVVLFGLGAIAMTLVPTLKQTRLPSTVPPLASSTPT